ncbi:immunity protein 50 of polymorphic toxin system [Streptomyces sp. BK022]|uniref:Imm50 family immunity protein n=1 Tax=Streptomyces sp. BK022 TaxID=2512123 RepID=UPI0010E3A7F2|nr:Imm50 family immunity protein [Streptomyces sp. BK022]RZU30225.1 immunity protein 50 of polymorphic toxin system [Streptomyces sp. BK022]
MPAEPWLTHLVNPQGLRAVYGAAPPPLTAVRLHRLDLRDEGPALTFHLDLPYPAEPPRKWAAQGFDTVQIELSFTGLSALTLHGFGTEITADVTLTAVGGGVAVHVTAPEITLEAVARTVYLAALRAYAQE